MSLKNNYPEGFEFNQNIYLNKMSYLVVPLMYKTPSEKTDYIQLFCEATSRYYMLKDKYLQSHKDSDMSIPFIYMQKLGSDIASCLHLKTQPCEIVKYKDREYLLIEDVQSEPSVIIMEPFCYYFDNLKSGERDLYEIYRRCINNFKDELGNTYAPNGVKPISMKCPLSYVVLFDIIINNNKRNARSYRILFKKGGIQNHEVLIENQFGSYSLSSNINKELMYDPNYLKNFFKFSNSLKEAKSFSEFILSKENIILNIIAQANYLNDAQKKLCKNIMLSGLSNLSKLRKILYN